MTDSFDETIRNQDDYNIDTNSTNLEEPNNKFGITMNVLKIIAVVLMFINHLGSGLKGYLGISNFFTESFHWYISRAAFVIFAFGVAEGMHYTHNKGKYIIRLLIFAVVSEIPFNLCFSYELIDSSSTNVMWTLLFGALACLLIDKCHKNIPLSILITLGFGIVCLILNTDYSFFGLIIVVSFYYFRDVKWKQLLITGIVFAIGNFLMYLVAYLMNGYSVSVIISAPTFWHYFFLELHGLTAWPLLILYNGKKSNKPSPKWLKWVFYAFYPAHLLLIYILLVILKTL